MKILKLQQPISENHLNAMFFDGLVAIGIDDEDNIYKVVTNQSGEIEFGDEVYVGRTIVELATKKTIIDDNWLEENDNSILVDKSFKVISETGFETDCEVFDSFDEIDTVFEEYLRNE